MALAAMLLFLGAKAEAAEDDAAVLDRRVQQVYLDAGWMLDRLPELFAQLEAGGAIHYGLWPAQPDVDAGEDAHPPSAWMAPFLFEAGTVRQALDAVVAANPVLSWEASGARIILRREPRSPRLALLLAVKVGELDVASIPEVDYRVATTLSRARRHALMNLPEPIAGEWRSDLAIDWPEEADHFTGRAPISLHPWPEDAEQTLEDVLHRLTPASEHAFWYAVDATDVQAAGHFFGSRLLRIAVTTWSPVRRQLSTPQLVQALHADDENLHGYLDARVRIDDAQRELQRRHHFNPGEVRAALTAGDTIAKLVGRGDDNAWYRVHWVTRLGDAALNRIVFDQARQVEKHKELPHPLTAFPLPSETKFDAALLPQWREVAKNFPDPDIRQRTRYQLDLHQWYEDGAEKSGRPKPRMPGIF